jgi:hypothetical protein
LKDRSLSAKGGLRNGIEGRQKEKVIQQFTLTSKSGDKKGRTKRKRKRKRKKKTVKLYIGVG